VLFKLVIYLLAAGSALGQVDPFPVLHQEAPSVQPFKPQFLPDADGWVPVERPQKPHPEEYEEDDGTWVVFSKEIEGSKFLVRFPEDPAYRSIPGGIQIEASHERDLLRLTVEKKIDSPDFERKILEVASFPGSLLIKTKKSEDGSRLDLFYRLGDRWVWERLLETPNLIFSFRTESPEMNGESHRQFTASLDVY